MIEELEDKISKLTWYMTSGFLSHPNYSIETILEVYEERQNVKELRAESRGFQKAIELLLSNPMNSVAVIGSANWLSDNNPYKKEGG